jgi:NAD(P)H-dependent FMN reductase
VNVLAISGSLNAISSNSALVRAMRPTSGDVDVVLWDELRDLPHFRPDEEGDEHVASLRRAVAQADAVLISTPEYAGGMPGALKNALDWLVGSGELYGKPVVIMSAAPSPERGANARRWVAEVAAMQGAAVRDSFTVAVSSSATESDIANTARGALARALAALER